MRSGARRDVEQCLTAFDLNFDIKLGRAAICEILMLTGRESAHSSKIKINFLYQRKHNTSLQIIICSGCLGK
jgi:hypothetical protein